MCKQNLAELATVTPSCCYRAGQIRAWPGLGCWMHEEGSALAPGWEPGGASQRICAATPVCLSQQQHSPRAGPVSFLGASDQHKENSILIPLTSHLPLPVYLKEDVEPCHRIMLSMPLHFPHTPEKLCRILSYSFKEDEIKGVSVPSLSYNNLWSENN